MVHFSVRKNYNEFLQKFEPYKAVIMLMIDQFEAATFPTHAIIQEVDVYYAQDRLFKISI